MKQTHGKKKRNILNFDCCEVGQVVEEGWEGGDVVVLHVQKLQVDELTKTLIYLIELR